MPRLLMRDGSPGLLAVVLLVVGLSLPPLTPTASAYQGFGSDTAGGGNAEVVHVTTLVDGEPGSLREALRHGNRTIVFDVAGTIELRDHLWVLGANITIDGDSAPRPGITLKNFGLVIRGNKGAHDIIVRGIRVRGAAIDGIQVANAAHHIVIDHVSIYGSGDGNIDITEHSRDVTVSWSILAEPAAEAKNMLIKYDPGRVTLHHNLFVGARQRNPQARVDNAGTRATDLVLDMRNNVVWDWRNGAGTHIWYGATANVVNNFYGSPGSPELARTRGLIVCRGECDGGVVESSARAFVEGNVSWDGADLLLNGVSTEDEPFPAPAVDTEPTCVAATRVVAEAGVQPRDPVDTAYLSGVQPSMCHAS